MDPSTNGANGRDLRGRFVRGNVGGPGNPHAAAIAKLRAAIFDAVSEEDLRAIVSKIIEKAKEGDLHAAALLLDRLLGRPAPERIDPEEIADELEERGVLIIHRHRPPKLDGEA